MVLIISRGPGSCAGKVGVYEVLFWPFSVGKFALWQTDLNYFSSYGFVLIIDCVLINDCTFGVYTRTVSLFLIVLLHIIVSSGNTEVLKVITSKHKKFLSQEAADGTLSLPYIYISDLMQCMYIILKHMSQYTTYSQCWVILVSTIFLFTYLSFCVKSLIHIYPPPSLLHTTGTTPLYFAAQEGRLGALKFLHEKGKCDLSYPSSDGRKPIHAACQCGHTHVVKVQCICTVYNTCIKLLKGVLSLIS